MKGGEIFVLFIFIFDGLIGKIQKKEMSKYGA